MSDLFGDFMAPDDAGAKGETLERCLPLPWPGADGLNEEFVRALLPRLVASSYRLPEELGIFGLRKGTVLKILARAKDLFSREKNILDIVVPPNGKVHVFGDTHGDLHSLVQAISMAGWPSEDNIYCFAGDYVDRGSWGVEVFILLATLKLWKKSCVFAIRGNHETEGCASRYGFEKEVTRKYDADVYSAFLRVFQAIPCCVIIRNLPLKQESSLNDNEINQSGSKNSRRTSKRKKKRGLEANQEPETIPEGENWRAALVPGERRIMVVHGGLFRSWRPLRKRSLELGDLHDLSKAHRLDPDPIDSIIEDVIWSDPMIESSAVVKNDLRGAGILYGQGAVDSFFKRNNLHGMIRAHEGPDMREKRPEMNDMLEGYSVDMELINGFVATVFTSANYPPDNPRGNKAAFATIYGRQVSGTQFVPEFTTFRKKNEPQDFVLFYNPKPDEPGATPRNSFS